MGLLDRVKQNQTGVPAPVAPATNGPATAAPASAYAAATAIPVARPAAAPAAAAPLSNLAARAAIAAGGEMIRRPGHHIRLITTALFGRTLFARR